MITLKQKLIAIKGSIDKWESVYQRKADGNSMKNCPLCNLYWDNTKKYCEGCPIYEKTKRKNFRFLKKRSKDWMFIYI